MKIKLMLLSAILFLSLGWNSKDGVLFFFFAVHLFTLSAGLILLKFDQKRHPEAGIEFLSPTDSSES